MTNFSDCLRFPQTVAGCRRLNSHRRLDSLFYRSDILRGTRRVKPLSHRVNGAEINWTGWTSRPSMKGCSIRHAQSPASASRPSLYFVLMNYRHCVELGRLVLNTWNAARPFTLFTHCSSCDVNISVEYRLRNNVVSSVLFRWRVGAVVWRRTCDQGVASSIPGRDSVS